MTKRVYKLNETELKKVVNEAVKKVVKEIFDPTPKGQRKGFKMQDRAREKGRDRLADRIGHHMKMNGGVTGLIRANGKVLDYLNVRGQKIRIDAKNGDIGNITETGMAPIVNINKLVDPKDFFPMIQVESPELARFIANFARHITGDTSKRGYGCTDWHNWLQL